MVAHEPTAGEPVIFRPGSKVQVVMEGEMLLAQVTYEGFTPKTNAMVWPKDVLASFLNELRDVPELADLAELAKWFRERAPDS